MAIRIECEVNGNPQTLDAEEGEPLLYALRNQLQLNGPKFGCGLAQCGACTVLVDGSTTRSCVVPASSVAGKQVTTLEGLGQEQTASHVQQAFIDQQAMQCGYCSNGMIMAATALLARNSDPTRDDIVAALDANLCRCGSHNRIIRAVQQAAKHAIADDNND